MVLDQYSVYPTTGGRERTALNWEVGRKPYIVNKNIMASPAYLHHEQYEDILAYCAEASEMAIEGFPGANTVVGIAGERGSGKTSFLHSLKDALSEDYYVLDIVDPSDFGTDMSILEFFLAYLFEAYRDVYPKYESRHGELSSLSLHTKFKKLTKTLSTLRIDKSLYNDENPSVEILSDMADRIKVRQCISE